MPAASRRRFTSLLRRSSSLVNFCVNEGDEEPYEGCKGAYYRDYKRCLWER